MDRMHAREIEGIFIVLASEEQGGAGWTVLMLIRKMGVRVIGPEAW